MSNISKQVLKDVAEKRLIDEISFFIGSGLTASVNFRDTISCLSHIYEGDLDKEIENILSAKDLVKILDLEKYDR